MSLSPNFLGFVGYLWMVVCCIVVGLLVLWFMIQIVEWVGVFS